MPRLLIALLACAVCLRAQTTVIRMGTLVPKGSQWYTILVDMGEQWKKITGGKVELKIYPNGEQGDESEMVDKVRIKKLQSVAISGAGLSGIDSDVSALQIPMMLDSYAELDYVRERIAPRLEKGLEQRGFIVLNWADAGWVYFFTKTPASTPDQLRRMKLCVLQGDNGTFEMYKTHGFHPVALAATDIMTGLQTGLIDAFQSPPLVALSKQWFSGAKNMLDVRFAQLVGATLIDKAVWMKIPAAQRDEMMKAARTAGVGLREEIRKQEAASLPLMQQFGLNIVKPDAATAAEWRRLAQSIYPQLRGGEIPVDLFDRVKQLRDEFRKSHPAQTAASKS